MILFQDIMMEKVDPKSEPGALAQMTKFIPDFSMKYIKFTLNFIR